MTPASQQSIQARVAAGVIFAGFVFSLAVNLPGHLSYDSVIELLEGRLGVYAGWHPPVTSWLLGLGDAILPGTALFVVLNTLLIFGSLYALTRLFAKPAWISVVLVAAFALTLQFMTYPGIVWKDVLFAAASVMGFVALARAGNAWLDVLHRNAWLAFAFVLLVLAALARQNGIVMLLGGVAAFGWIAARVRKFTLRAAIVFGGAALAATLLALMLCNIALGARLEGESGPLRQFKLLQLYDTVGMLAARPDMPLDIIDRETPVLAHFVHTEGLRLYTPQRNDPLVASAPMLAAFNAAPAGVLQRQWLSLIAHHPWLYLETRADAFYWVFLTPRIDLCLPFYEGVSGPQETMDDLNLDARWDARDLWLEYYGDRFMGTPLLQHGFFALLAIGAAVILLWRRRTLDIPIALLQLGALVYVATFFFISIACDYRYLYALDISAMTGWFYLALDWRWPEALMQRTGNRVAS